MIYIKVSENGAIRAYESAVSDSVKYETVKFDFPEKWNGYTKTAVFGHENKLLNVILNSGDELCTGENECYIPHEALKFPGFTVSVFGVSGDSLATTERAIIEVRQSGYGSGDLPSKPTLGEYRQLINLAKETRRIAQSARDGVTARDIAFDNSENGFASQNLQSALEEIAETLALIAGAVHNLKIRGEISPKSKIRSARFRR